MGGKCETTIEFNLWKAHGGTGEVAGSAEMPLATYKKPITEHIKGIFRGRKAWGLKHHLVLCAIVLYIIA